MLEWLLPHICVACRRPGSTWCTACRPEGVLRPPSPTDTLHSVFSVTRFDTPAGRVLRNAKLERDRGSAQIVARRFAEVLEPPLRHAPLAWIVPAPSTRQSRARRGFSVASLLARALSRRLQTPMRHGLTSTAAVRLSTLGAHDRKRALTGRIRGRYPLPGTVLLVDDVLTSGATAHACATELLGHSTERVVLATFCVVPRAGRQQSATRREQPRRLEHRLGA